jgi:hypothetical protein
MFRRPIGFHAGTLPHKARRVKRGKGKETASNSRSQQANSVAPWSAVATPKAFGGPRFGSVSITESAVVAALCRRTPKRHCVNGPAPPAPPAVMRRIALTMRLACWIMFARGGGARRGHRQHWNYTNLNRT